MSGAEGKKTWETDYASVWARYRPPARPSRSELALIEGFLRERGLEGARALVLGSTPELRDLCASNGIAPVVVDFKRENFERLSRLKKTRAPETFVEQDWRKMQWEKPFDLVLGDHCLNVLPQRDGGVFLERVRASLAREGFAVLRVTVQAPAPQSLRALLARYEKSHARRDPVSFLEMPLFLHFYDRKKGFVEIAWIARWLRRARKKGWVSRRVWNGFARVGYFSSRFRYTMPSQAALERALQKRFVLLARAHGRGLHAGMNPLYFLQRKK